MRLREIKKQLPDKFTYKGKSYTMSYYSLETFPTKTHPTRSKEIIWDEDNGNKQVYLKEDKIELLE
jgi:hypothetical protein